MESSQSRYVYDRMDVVQERNSGKTPTVTYTRGTDLSGTLQSADGIGGLLARSHGYSGGTWSTQSHYHADGNGNITAMLNSSQASVAAYRYDPFGRTVTSSGTLASVNTYRFSSKEFNATTGLYYYGYRFYDPNLQRWLNRDPKGELGAKFFTRSYQSILNTIIFSP
jgi:RHS repeat-associated protein